MALFKDPTLAAKVAAVLKQSPKQLSRCKATLARSAKPRPRVSPPLAHGPTTEGVPPSPGTVFCLQRTQSPLCTARAEPGSVGGQDPPQELRANAPAQGRQTDRQTRTMWAEAGKERRLGGIHAEAFRAKEMSLAQMSLYLKQRRLPRVGKALQRGGEGRVDGMEESTGLGQAFRALGAGRLAHPHTTAPPFPGSPTQPGALPGPCGPSTQEDTLPHSGRGRRSHVKLQGWPSPASCFSIWAAHRSCLCELDSRWTREGKTTVAAWRDRLLPQMAGPSAAGHRSSLLPP